MLPRRHLRRGGIRGSRGLRGVAPLVFAAAVLLPRGAAAQSTDDLESAGDVLQVALPVAGLVSTFLVGDPEGRRWDREGTRQILLSFGSSWATVYALKYSVGKLRPNEAAKNSWPSGHTMGAFVGASFLGTRYGKAWGVPAYGAAILTGYSRVASQWHFADDVVAGASIAMLWNWFWVTPHPGRIRVLPEVSDDYTGVTVTIAGDGAEEELDDDPGDPENFTYLFEFGPAYLSENRIRAPRDGGTGFDLADFQKREDPTTRAGAHLHWSADPRTRVLFSYTPFESRDQGVFEEDVVFAGETFPAGESIKSAYRLHDIQMRWEWRLFRERRFRVHPGLGLMIQDTFVALATEDGSVQALQSQAVLLPYLSLGLYARVADRWGLEAGAQGIHLDEDRMLSGGLWATYQASRVWEFGVGYLFYEREIETELLANRVLYNVAVLAVGRSW